jgi:hypothetical protein
MGLVTGRLKKTPWQRQARCPQTLPDPAPSSDKDSPQELRNVCFLTFEHAVTSVSTHLVFRVYVPLFFHLINTNRIPQLAYTPDSKPCTDISCKEKL